MIFEPSELEIEALRKLGLRALQRGMYALHADVLLALSGNEESRDRCLEFIEREWNACTTDKRGMCPQSN